jgi:hypothetical protein
MFHHIFPYVRHCSIPRSISNTLLPLRPSRRCGSRNARAGELQTSATLMAGKGASCSRRCRTTSPDGDAKNMGKSWEKHGVLLGCLPVFTILVNLDVTYNLCEPVYFTWKTIGKWSYKPYLDVHPTLGFIIHIYIVYSILYIYYIIYNIYNILYYIYILYIILYYIYYIILY